MRMCVVTWWQDAKLHSLEEAEKNFFHTHHYNPLTATFYDPEVDRYLLLVHIKPIERRSFLTQGHPAHVFRDFIESKREHDRKCAEVKARVVPPRIQESEGNL